MLKLNIIVCRPLVDSATDLGDREGVFLNSCVTIVVGGGGRGSSGRGTVVQQVPILASHWSTDDPILTSDWSQAIMPGSTHCTDIFIESWELLLNAKWNQVQVVFVLSIAG